MAERLPSTFVSHIDSARVGAEAEKPFREAIINYRGPLNLTPDHVIGLELQANMAADSAIAASEESLTDDHIIRWFEFDNELASVVAPEGKASELNIFTLRIGRALARAIDSDYFTDVNMKKYHLYSFSKDMMIKGVVHAEKSGVFCEQDIDKRPFEYIIENVKTLAGAEGYFLGSLLFTEANGAIEERYLNEALAALRHIRDKEFHEQRPDVDFQHAILVENAAILSEFRQRHDFECKLHDRELSSLGFTFNRVARKYILGDAQKKS